MAETWTRRGKGWIDEMTCHSMAFGIWVCVHKSFANRNIDVLFYSTTLQVSSFLSLLVDFFTISPGINLSCSVAITG
jgi:hypothetical protein